MDGTHLCDGISQWCIMDFVTRRIIRVPKDFVGEFYTTPILPDGFERFRPEAPVPAGTYTITEADLDGNNHTNNCRYADMIEQVLPHTSGADFSISFAKETRLGDVIELFTSPAENGRTIVGGNVDGQNVFSALL
jgi:acyl-ACP thioesterase